MFFFVFVLHANVVCFCFFFPEHNSRHDGRIRATSKLSGLTSKIKGWHALYTRCRRTLYNKVERMLSKLEQSLTYMQVDMLFDKSSLSPYIRFGCLSVRYFLFEVKKLASKDPTVEPLLKDVTGKLLQREFYFTVAKQVIIRSITLYYCDHDSLQGSIFLLGNIVLNLEILL